MQHLVILQITLLIAINARFPEARPFYHLQRDTLGERGYAWEESGEFEGDIMLKEEGNVRNDSARNGLITRQRHWPKKTLVYKIDDTYEEPYQKAIEKAIHELNSKTCVKLRPKNEDDEDYVFITGEGATGCSSFVGRHGGEQALKLRPRKPGKGCFRKGTILHELLHALGFFHQQSAPERDNYVKIIWENIRPGREVNFRKYGNDTVTNYGVTYDYKSVMHYSAYAFSKNEEKTIEPLDEDAEIGQREDMSPKDIQKLKNMYKCEDKSAEGYEADEEENQEKDFDDFEDFK